MTKCSGTNSISIQYKFNYTLKLWYPFADPQLLWLYFSPSSTWKFHKYSSSVSPGQNLSYQKKKKKKELENNWLLCPRKLQFNNKFMKYIYKDHMCTHAHSNLSWASAMFWAHWAWKGKSDPKSLLSRRCHDKSM